MGHATRGTTSLVAGLLGAVSGIALAVWPVSSPEDTWRYPLTAGGFVVAQVWFAVQHVGLLAGILALPREGRWGRIGVLVAGLGMALLAVTELLAIGARHDSLEQDGYLNGLYGAASILTGLGLVVAGAVLRRHWSGWAVVLAAGIWVFVPLTPALASGNFLAARLGITGWMLLFAAMGWALARAGSSAEAAVPATA